MKETESNHYFATMRETDSRFFIKPMQYFKWILLFLQT